MKRTKNNQNLEDQQLKQRVLKAVNWHFPFVAAYGLSIIIFDSWNLITHEVVAQRWTYGGLLAALVCIIWFIIKRYANSPALITLLAYLLVIADIAFAAINVYTQRGMASKAVMLFVIPLLLASKLRERSTILVTAGLSVIAYTIVAVRYFHLHYGEGFRVELYGEVFFYSALIIIIAGILLPVRR